MATAVLPETPEFELAPTGNMSDNTGVDREKRVIRGYVVAQMGEFKSEGRGQFTENSLRKIVKLGNAQEKGLRMRYRHPNMTNDGMGKQLGRAKNFYMSTAIDRFGNEVPAVRADAYILRTAMRGNVDGGMSYGQHAMDLAEEDSDMMSSSLVLKPKRHAVLDEDGTRKEDEEGNPIPDVWEPMELIASDLVEIGDAVDGLLSYPVGNEKLPDNVVRFVSEQLDMLFSDQPCEVIGSRCHAFVDRYLANKFGTEIDCPPPQETEEPMTKEQETNTDQFVTQEDFNAKMGEVLSAVNTLVERDTARQEEHDKLALQAKIREKGKMAGASEDLVTKCINEGLSLELATELFTMAMTKNRETTQGLEETLESNDPDTAFQREFHQHLDMHMKMGVDINEYCDVMPLVKRDEKGLTYIDMGEVKKAQIAKRLTTRVVQEVN